MLIKKNISFGMTWDLGLSTFCIMQIYQNRCHHNWRCVHNMILNPKNSTQIRCLTKKIKLKNISICSPCRSPVDPLSCKRSTRKLFSSEDHDMYIYCVKSRYVYELRPVFMINIIMISLLVFSSSIYIQFEAHMV